MENGLPVSAPKFGARLHAVPDMSMYRDPDEYDGDAAPATAVKAPFDFEVTESSTGMKTGKIVRCNFMFDGENYSLSDFPVSGSGSVYLCCTQVAPSPGYGEQAWEFSLSAEEAEAPEGGRAVNYKLYDIENNDVVIDYRTTFMELKSPHECAKFVVKTPDELEETGKSVVLDAINDAEVHVSYSRQESKFIDVTSRSSEQAIKLSNGTTQSVRISSSGSSGSKVDATYDASHRAQLIANSLGGRLNLSAGSSKSVVLNPGGLKQGTEAKFHTLTVKDADGNETKYDVLADKDIEIFAAKGSVLKDIELKYESYELQMKKTTIDLETGEETEGSFETVFTTEEHSAQG